MTMSRGPTTVQDSPTVSTPKDGALVPAIKSWLPPRAALLFWGHARKIVVLVVGVTLILIGIAGLILPVAPGWVVIFGGLALLATEFAWARWILKQARVRFEQLKQATLQTWQQGPAAVPPPHSEDT